MEITCAYCNKKSNKDTGDVNRAKKIGAPLYCNKTCAGMARRISRTDEEKKKIKSDYDKQYRYYNKDGIKEKKAQAFKEDYASNPEKYKEQRKKRYPKHIEYLQTPEYKAWKQKYDQKYRSKKLYGDFAEAAVALRELRSVVDNREAKKQQNNINKSIKRKRNATKNVKRKELESCTMGIHQPG